MPDIKELREKKKRQALMRPLFIKNQLLPSESFYTHHALKKMVADGRNVTKKNAEFVTIIEDEKQKYFLKKPKTSVDATFGVQLVRILSDKEFIIKRNSLFLSADKAVSTVKWDSKIASSLSEFVCLKDLFVDYNYLVRKFPQFDAQKFAKQYARLCGILHVFGEVDINPSNFLINKDNLKPTRIDCNFLSNELFFGLCDEERYRHLVSRIERFRVYGCPQAAFLLRYHFTGQDSRSHDFCNIIEKNFEMEFLKFKTKDFRGNLVAQDIKNLSQNIINYFNEGIDDKLCDAIGKFLDGNVNLQEEFIEFMQGVRDAIELSKDREFMTQYTKKYRQEAGEDAYQIVTILADFLTINSAQAEKQFGNYFKLADKFAQELKQERKPLAVIHKPTYAEIARRSIKSETIAQP